MDSYWQWNKDNFPWHYDPSSKESDVQYVGRFVSNKLQEGVDNVIKNFKEDDVYDEVSIKGEPYNDEAKEIMEGYHNDLTRAGYTSHNTGGRQTTSSSQPRDWHSSSSMTPAWWWPALNNIREEVSLLLAFTLKIKKQGAARQTTIAFAIRDIRICG